MLLPVSQDVGTRMTGGLRDFLVVIEEVVFDWVSILYLLHMIG